MEKKGEGGPEALPIVRQWAPCALRRKKNSKNSQGKSVYERREKTRRRTPKNGTLGKIKGGGTGSKCRSASP